LSGPAEDNAAGGFLGALGLTKQEVSQLSMAGKALSVAGLLGAPFAGPVGMAIGAIGLGNTMAEHGVPQGNNPGDTGPGGATGGGTVGGNAGTGGGASGPTFGPPPPPQTIANRGVGGLSPMPGGAPGPMGGGFRFGPPPPMAGRAGPPPGFGGPPPVPYSPRRM
jgi:hypothetical protein